jgi:hypothetical protein
VPDFRLAYRPFAEQQAYFRRKASFPSARWDDLMRGEHAHGFMAAGVARLDVLDDLREAIQAAIDQGETFGDFRARFDDIVARHGWIGGAGDESDARRAWRQRVIYRTNLRTSYMAGRWEQLSRFPYLRYQHNTVANPREEHQAWDGMVLATDDPWWDTHYPPNGWGCACTVTGVSEARLRALGKAGPDTAPDPRAGAVPPEWAYHPGKAARSMGAAEAFGRKVMALPPAWRQIALDDAARRPVPFSQDWPTVVDRVIATGHTGLRVSPVAFLRDDVLTAAAATIRRRNSTAAGLRPASALIAMTDRQMAHALRGHAGADRAAVGAALRELPQWLMAADTMVWRQVSPDRLVFGRPLPDGRLVLAYVRIGSVPVRPVPGAKVQSNWVVTVEVRRPEEIADHVRLR